VLQGVVQLALQGDRPGEKDGVHALDETPVGRLDVQIDDIDLLVGIEPIVVRLGAGIIISSIST
jgi:hypothetical protein